MSEYWFARRFPVGHPNNAMAPIHWKGWAVAFGFAFLLMTGATTFFWLGSNGQILYGALAFIAAAALGMVWFIGLAERTCDKTRTIADYRKDRARA